MLLQTMNPMRVDEDGYELLRQFNETITQAEEKELMQYHHHVISQRETWESRGQGSHCRLPWSAADDPTKVIQDSWMESEDGSGSNVNVRKKQHNAKRSTEPPAPSKRPRLHLYPPFEGFRSIELFMDVIRTTILLPRCISSLIKPISADRHEEENENEPTKAEIALYFQSEFQNYCAALDLFPLLDWTRFQIQLQSANPTSWRFIVTGYRKVVDAFLRYLEQLLLSSPT